jgi:hypothetical protein
MALQEEINKGINIFSKIPYIGGLSRLQRYPTELVRVLGSGAQIGIADLLGISNDYTRNLGESMSKPMWISQDEWDRSLGAEDMGRAALDATSVGAEVLNFIPGLGALDDATKAAVAAKTGGKFLPWLTGKAVAGIPMGASEGLQTMSMVEDYEDIPGHLAKSTAYGPLFNIAAGAVQEGAKGLQRIGQRGQTKSLGLGTKGTTTDEMIETLEDAKKTEGLGANVQRQLDKGAQKADEFTQKKLGALRTMQEPIERARSQAVTAFEDAIDSQLNPKQLRSQPLYDDILQKLGNANTPQELDDIAVAAGNEVRTMGGQYNPEGTDTKKILDSARKGVVKTLGEVSDDYSAAKKGLHQVLGRIKGKEMINEAYKANKAISSPLTFQAEIPGVPRGVFSTAGNIVGGIESGIGKLLGSDATQNLLARGGTELAARMGAGQTLQEQVTPQDLPAVQEPTGQGAPSGMIDQGMGGAPGQAGFGGPSGGGIIETALMERGLVPQKQQQQGIDMEKVSMDLMQAVLAGQISPTQAQYAMQTLQSQYGGPDITGQINQLAQSNPEQAQALLGEAVLSGQIDPTVAKTYSGLLGFGDGSAGGYSQDVLNAQLAYQDLQEIKDILEGGEKGVPWQSILPKEGGYAPAQVLDNSVRNITDTIARTRTGAAMNLKEEELYKDFAPTVWDTEESRKDKLERLERLFLLVMENEGYDASELQEIESPELQGIQNDYEIEEYPGIFDSW